VVDNVLALDIALCIIAAWVVAVVSQLLRLPVLLAYLVAGFTIGPRGLKWITNVQDIGTISEIGLALLLFMVGLEIDLKKMLSAGRVLTLTALVQVAGCTGLGWLVFYFIGPAPNALGALYLAVAAAMSSTVIIVKILYDQRELETLAGRVTLGVLVLQDVATILFLAVQPNLNNPALLPLIEAFGSVMLLLSVAFLASRVVLPPVFKLIARLPELVLVGALAWCFAMAGFASYLKLSSAIGALVAGVMISTFPYTLDIVARVTSLRDFFVTLFFVSLGMATPLPTWAGLGWMLFFCLFLVVSRCVTVFPVLYSLRQGYRVSLLSTINLCQLSELSLVLLALGRKSGDVSDNIIGIAAFAFAVLAIGSTYAMLDNRRLLQFFSPWLNRLGLRDLDHTAFFERSADPKRRICLLGFSWTASSLLAEMLREQPALVAEILVVDFNPVVYQRLRQMGVRAAYGDISQRDVLQHAGLQHAEIIICSLPNTILKGANNLKILRQVRELNPTAVIIVHAELLSDVPALYAAGASYITAPRLLEAADLLHAIEAAEKNLLAEKRAAQTARLAERNEVIP
jgi:Kef-type K+ transport system membrane component KefB